MRRRRNVALGVTVGLGVGEGRSTEDVRVTPAEGRALTFRQAEEAAKVR